jgi:hypothetical protein
MGDGGICEYSPDQGAPKAGIYVAVRRAQARQGYG